MPNQQVVSQITVVEITEQIRARAALLAPVTLRLLDALQIATTLEVADELDGVGPKHSIRAKVDGLTISSVFRTDANLAPILLPTELVSADLS
jgi:hypothetical protein